MRDSNCIFCKIVAGEVPSYKIYEDKEHVAFLDIFPVTKGQALVAPKKHLDSLFSKAEDKELAHLVLAAKKVANLLREKLPAERISMVFEGLDVNHLHAKLFPDLGIMHLGPKASDSELNAMHKRITR
jgi:diadenosine tetraphosphate (Ap4A) HIT family hydrolase